MTATTNGPAAGPAPLLTTRALNRALLDRQLLLSRGELAAPGEPEKRSEQVINTIDHLVGMQAQAPFPPYFGLWTRLRGFRPDDLVRPLLDRQVVRIVLMRGTVHLVSAADCLALRTLVQPIMDRDLRTNRQAATGLTPDELVELTKFGHEELAKNPRTVAALTPLLGERWPASDSATLTYAVRNLLPLVQIPPRAVWGSGGQAVCTPADAWIDPTVSRPLSLDDMVLRYLAAFGPASTKDAQTWSGLTRLGEVIDRLRPRLMTFRDENGRELFDVPEAPRPDPDRSAPVRFLPEFDNILLSHADRSRIVAEASRMRLISKNGLVPSTVLVDGMVSGSWRVSRKAGRATLTIQPFRRIPKRAESALTNEGGRLLAFAEPTADHDIQMLPAAD